MVGLVNSRLNFEYLWNDREKGQRFKLYQQLYLLSGQVLDESLVKGSQRQQDRQTALIASRFVLLISILTAAPAPGGATCIFLSLLHCSCSATTGTPRYEQFKRL